MEPRRILMAIQPPDLIKELMKARQGQISKLYPQFKEEFYQMQRKLKEHAQMLKNRKEEGSEQLNRHVIEQLQLKDYKLLRPNPKFSIKCNKISKGFTKKNEDPVPPREQQSRRNSEISQTGFRPYHISNFKKTLQSYKLSYNDNTIRDSVDK